MHYEMRGMHNEMPPGEMSAQAHSGHSEYSAKIVPRIQITNKKGPYLGFSQKFEGIWAIFLGRCTIQQKGLRGGSPFEMLQDPSLRSG